MGFITGSPTHADLSVEERRVSFSIHRGGLDYGQFGGQHIELPLVDVPHLIVLLQELYSRNRHFIDENQSAIRTPSQRAREEEDRVVAAIYGGS